MLHSHLDPFVVRSLLEADQIRLAIRHPGPLHGGPRPLRIECFRAGHEAVGLNKAARSRGSIAGREEVVHVLSELLSLLLDFPGRLILGSSTALSQLNLLAQLLSQEEPNLPREIILQREDFGSRALQRRAADL